MKREISVFSILLALAVLLSACVQEPMSPTEPTAVPTMTPTTEPTEAPTDPTTEPTEAPTTEPTEPPTTVPTTEPPTEPPTEEPTAARSDIEFFQQLLKYSDGIETGGYNAALNCEFEKLEDLNVALFFRSHFDMNARWEDLSDEEKTFLESRGITSWLDIEKHSAETMDAVLQEYFGLPLSAFQGPLMVYYEKTDCYYRQVSDAMVAHRFQVTEVEYEEAGIVKVYYLFDPQNEFMGKYVLTLQEKQGEGETGYYILSHLRVE